MSLLHPATTPQLRSWERPGHGGAGTLEVSWRATARPARVSREERTCLDESPRVSRREFGTLDTRVLRREANPCGSFRTLLRDSTDRQPAGCCRSGRRAQRRVPRCGHLSSAWDASLRPLRANAEAFRCVAKVWQGDRRHSIVVNDSQHVCPGQPYNAANHQRLPLSVPRFPWYY